jgi:sulfur-oxidizing protein SoxX
MLAMALALGASETASQAFAGDLMKAWGTAALMPIAAATPPHPPACGGSPLPPGERAKSESCRVAPNEGGAANADRAGSYRVAGNTQAAASALLPYDIRGDAIPEPLGGRTGDAVRGKAIVLDRRRGNCLICHAFPIEGEPFQGEIGPPMTGVASRLTKAQIRLRLIDQSRLNPETIMPPFYRVEGLTNVAPEYEGRPALDAQEIEDVVAYLAGLTE